VRQAFPQAPQLVMLVEVSTHRPEQTVRLPGHEHASGAQSQLPPAQLAPVAQAAPQAPQAPGSVVTSAHLPEQTSSPAGQAHTPYWQTAPGAQAVAQSPQ
jgi:hypothetical protein